MFTPDVPCTGIAARRDDVRSGECRLGSGACATFGMNFMPQQVLLLAKNFDEIFILYDTEELAQDQANKLYHQLRGYDKKVEILFLSADLDPGDLSNDEAKYIMKEIGL